MYYFFYVNENRVTCLKQQKNIELYKYRAIKNRVIINRITPQNNNFYF